MKLDMEYHSLAVTTEELSVISKQAALLPNKLSPMCLPEISQEDTKAILAEFNSLNPQERTKFASAASILNSPSQIARLHYCISDHSLSRLLIGWSKENENEVAMLAKTGKTYALSLRSLTEIRVSLSRVLAIDATLTKANFNTGLSAMATVVYLAVIDYFHYAWYQSLLNHARPAESFLMAELMKRIGDDADDFRWPLLFFSQSLPRDIDIDFSEEEVAAALDELAGNNLIRKNEPEKIDSTPILYSLNSDGEIISDGILHNVSKVSLTVSRIIRDGETGHESLLLIRDMLYLWLFDMAGNDGVIASIDKAEFDSLLTKMFTLPEPEAIAATKASEEIPAVKTGTPITTQAEEDLCCPKCNITLPADSNFCPSCGSPTVKNEPLPETKLCPSCQQKLEPDDTFCSNCGKKL